MKFWILRARLVALLVFLWAAQVAQAQGYYDNATRFGQNGLFGSARAMGMGGVQMATGADATALGTNPAAPGLMRKAELQFSLMPGLYAGSTDFLGGTADASRFRSPIGSFTLAITDMKDDIEPGTFRGGTWTLSYNRLAVFDRKSTWEGTHKLSPQPGDTIANSLVDYYLANLNTPGLFPSDILGKGSFGGGIDDVIMAYRTYLLDVSNNQFVSVIPRGDVLKKGYWNQKLSQGMWNFGYSGNFNDKVYVGASLGYYTADFSGEVQYGEQLLNVVVNPNNPNFNYLQGFKNFNFDYTKNLSQTCKGITGNLGVLIKANDAFRIGGSIQLPSVTWINETYSASARANYNGISYWFPDYYNLNVEDTTSLINEYNYRLTIPAKYRVGATYIAGKSGMIGVDLEYTDLSLTRLSEGDGNYSFSTENQIIKQNYQPTLNVRAGGELRFEDLRIRLGYAYMPTPLKASSPYINNIHSDAHYLTGGLGGRYETWYWDAAMVVGFWKTRYSYITEVMPLAETKIQSTQLRAGVGFYF